MRIQLCIKKHAGACHIMFQSILLVRIQCHYVINNSTFSKNRNSTMESSLEIVHLSISGRK